MAAGNTAPSRGSFNMERLLGDRGGGHTSAMLKILGPRRGKYARGQPEREASPALSLLSCFWGVMHIGLPFWCQPGLG